MVSSGSAISGHESRTAAGIASISIGILLFAIHNALGKWLAADYSPWQIMFFRGLFAFIPFAAYAAVVERGGALRSRHPWLQVIRAALGFASNLFFIFAYREMPLADAVAIGYAAPIFIVVLSVPLLSERVGPQRAAAAFVGFIGVLMIAPPGAGLLSPGTVYALGGTLCYALLIIATRRLGAFDRALRTVVYSSGIYALAALVPMTQVWVTPGPIDFALLAATGLLGGTGMLLFAYAYRHAPAAVLAPFDYTAMVWAALFGFLIWGDTPSAPAAAGMVVIAASGLYLMRHERLRRFQPDKP